MIPIASQRSFIIKLFDLSARVSPDSAVEHHTRDNSEDQTSIRPEFYIVATPCVMANHGALLELTHGRQVLTAFDQDFYENEAVCFHLASLIARRLRHERTLATTRIASWDAGVKGIDDAAVRNLPIASISVQRWLDRLGPWFRQIATRFDFFQKAPKIDFQAARARNTAY